MHVRVCVVVIMSWLRWALIGWCVVLPLLLWLGNTDRWSSPAQHMAPSLHPGITCRMVTSPCGYMMHMINIIWHHCIVLATTTPGYFNIVKIKKNNKTSFSVLDRKSCFLLPQSSSLAVWCFPAHQSSPLTVLHHSCPTSVNLVYLALRFTRPTFS